MEGRPLHPRPELLASHHRELGVEAVMFLAPLRQLPVPLVPPSLRTQKYRNDDISTGARKCVEFGTQLDNCTMQNSA